MDDKSNPPQLISCDEAGFTGNRLLDNQQTHFAYASVTIGNDEAASLIEGLRKSYRLQGSELKAFKLLKHDRGRGAIFDLLQRMEGRFLTTVYDKKLCLATKLFEYIYEPVLQENNALFYRNDLHRFVATYLYMQMVASGAGVNTLVSEFEAFMRSLNPADAPSAFGHGGEEQFDMLLEPIMTFARCFNVVIARETRDLRGIGEHAKWVLELSISALASHLRHWGERFPLLKVVCDDSKPLRAQTDVLNVMINRPRISYFGGFGRQRPMTWNMSRPISFASSLSIPAIQIADVVAGVSAAVVAHADDPELACFFPVIQAHLGEECILPDMSIIDLDGDNAPVNLVVLQELARRAENWEDPLEGMGYFYELARRDLPRFRSMCRGSD
ncbi:DUF3800 domain-containing protein [Agrobacterium tumefaciens]|uniref:DUF3800 domain-containing protein n=1 Tax=Agrobacterium tumefaciens TaxID=358 RepID=A0A546XU59_AGRTU|nr:DUF3800 domain-containing protein [Agrobacterium tumefaciens]